MLTSFIGTHHVTHCPAIMSGERAYTFMRELPTPSCVNLAVWSDHKKMQVYFKETPEHEAAAQHHSAGLYRLLGNSVFSTTSVYPYLIYTYVNVWLRVYLSLYPFRSYQMEDGRVFWSNHKFVLFCDLDGFAWWIGPELDGELVLYSCAGSGDTLTPPSSGTQLLMFR